MLTLPDGIQVTRNLKAEALLVEKARHWIESEQRTPGLHASDALDPRLAFFNHTNPQPLPDRLVTTFLVGKVLHAFVIAAHDDRTFTNTNLAETDTGSSHSTEFGLSFSPDIIHKGKVIELKTSRSFYSAKEGTPLSDLDTYLEQLLVYMAATDTLSCELWVLYLNERDEARRTAPTFRAFEVSITSDDLLATKEEIRNVINLLKEAIKNNDPRTLPLCREWKCGRRNCGYYDACKPEGRYGTKAFDEIQGIKKTKVKRS